MFRLPLPQIGPFSPNTLARSPLPPKLRAANLTLEDEAPTQKFAESATREGTLREEDSEKYSRAATLLLAARDRVLSLSEQRVSALYQTSNHENPCPMSLRADRTLHDGSAQLAPCHYIRRSPVHPSHQPRTRTPAHDGPARLRKRDRDGTVSGRSEVPPSDSSFVRSDRPTVTRLDWCRGLHYRRKNDNR